MSGFTWRGFFRGAATWVGAVGLIAGAAIAGAVGVPLWVVGLTVSGAAMAFRALSQPQIKKVGRDQNVVSTVAPLPVVYGTARVPAIITFVATSADNSRLWMVCVLCHGPVAGIDEIYFDGYVAVTADGTVRGKPSDIVITSSSAANPTVVTAASHGLVTGDNVLIWDHSSTPDINGQWSVTVPAGATNTFTIPVAVTGAGSGGKFHRLGPDYTASYLTYAKYYGSATQGSSADLKGGSTHWGIATDATLLMFYRPEYLPTSLLAGVAYLLFDITYNPDVFPGGIPQVSAVVRGRTLYDPRDASTSYSTNPVLAVRDYLTNTTYGLGAAAGDVDDTAVGAEADYCDTLAPAPSGKAQVAIVSVTAATTCRVSAPGHGLTSGDSVWIQDNVGSAPDINGLWVATVTSTSSFSIPLTVTVGAAGGTVQQLTTQTRYQCNGMVDTSRTLKDNIETLLTSCRGQLAYWGGTYHPYVRRVATPSTFALTEDNIVGDWEFSVPGAKEKPNAVRATFINADKSWQPETFDWPLLGRVNPYLADDNSFANRRDIELPFTAARYMAERIAMVSLEEARSGILVQVTATEAAMALTVGDVVNVTHSTPAWTVKPFWVMGVAITPDHLVRLSLMEYEATAYDDQMTDPATLGRDTNLPSPWTVAPPTNLTATNTPGETILRLNWTAAQDARVERYEVQGKRTSSPADSAFREFGYVSADNTTAQVGPVAKSEAWDVQVRSVSVIGVRSDWATATCTVASGETVVVSYSVSADATGVTYSIDAIGLNYTRAEIYSVQNSGSGGTNPSLTTANLAGVLLRGVYTLRIPTTANYYRRSRILGYGHSLDVAYDSGVIETRAASSGAPPSAAPTTLASSTASSDTIAITWSNAGDTTSTTRVYQDSVVVQTVAASLTTTTLGDLAPSTTYQVALDHYRNGQASAQCTTVAMTTTAQAGGPATFTHGSAYATTDYRGRQVINYDLTWTSVGAWEIYESDSSTLGSGGGCANGASGTTWTLSRLAGSGSWYYSLRGTSPQTDWTALASQPLDYSAL